MYEILCIIDWFDIYIVYIGFFLFYLIFVKGFVIFVKEGERGKNKMGENIFMNIVNMNNK